jgi:beta-carotene 3-hydroxylase
MINLILVLSAFAFMEFVAWSNHKYVMHGFLWRWHKDHHRLDGQSEEVLHTEAKRWEKNDLFFVVYAVPAMILIMTSVALKIEAFFYLGLGITLYGLTYFLIHDILIHNRLDIPFLRNPKNKYFKALVKAHRAHHWPKTKQDFANFGLLLFPKRFYKQ